MKTIIITLLSITLTLISSAEEMKSYDGKVIQVHNNGILVASGIPDKMTNQQIIDYNAEFRKLSDEEKAVRTEMGKRIVSDKLIFVVCDPAPYVDNDKVTLPWLKPDGKFTYVSNLGSKKTIRKFIAVDKMPSTAANELTLKDLALEKDLTKSQIQTLRNRITWLIKNNPDFKKAYTTLIKIEQENLNR